MKHLLNTLYILSEDAKAYRAKSYHKAINLEDANVLELFMLPEGRLVQDMEKKYTSVFHAWLIASFEFYATNTVLSDYQKYNNLFMKFIKVDHYTLVRRVIQNKYYSSRPLPEKKCDSDGYEIKVFHELLPDEVRYHQAWLEYNDYFDVDLLRGELNSLLPKDGEQEPEILVTRGTLTSRRSIWSEAEKRLAQNGFLCGPFESMYMGPQETQECMALDDCLLERIYERILADKNVDRA